MGRVIGTAGGSLATADTSWAKNEGAVAAGARGEQLTATVLAEWARTHDGTVLHDLAIPGSAANVDHVILGARELLVIDSKFTKPSFMWTFRGTTRHGLTKTTWADKKTIGMGIDRLQAILRNAGSKVTVRRVGIMALHPSRQSPNLNLWFYRPDSARAVHSKRLKGALRSAPRGRAEPLAESILAHNLKK